MNFEQMKNSTLHFIRFFDLAIADNAGSHIQAVLPRQIDCGFKGMNYSVTAIKGMFSTPGEGIVFRITPEFNSVILNFSKNNNR